ncbi:MAG: 4-hydroxy-3-methylbut-2-enyl diphosphate reductase [Desulfovibrio sp.]|nr:4-hydroxy-3-methylbut-2-enyl diphosphate reductase [Desulfovibrio sp.]
MEVYRAKTAGFCMGVSLALQKLDAALLEKGSSRICTLGPIIHNPQVLRDYEEKGVACLDENAQLHAKDVVVIRAHGISRSMEEEIRRHGAHIVDATCPKVKKAQLAIAKATLAGATLLLFGEAEHPEVRGLVSYAQGTTHVFASREELEALPLQPQKPYVLASQTTQDQNLFDAFESRLHTKIAQLTVLSTICDATCKRQEEARDIASKVDIMVVIGGRQSGNTRRLADIAALSGIETHHVECVQELEAKKFFQKRCAGLTAGASTPKKLIDAAHAWLLSL